ncbi:hypothetical protein ABPG74_014945 [Tetrahymena malaccensis]
MNNNRKLVNVNQTQDDIQSKTFIFEFQNLQQSSNNQTCLQKQQQAWSSDNCTGVTENGKYYCNCKGTNPTTVTDDLKSLLINKNVQEAFSSDGISNISNFELFYEYAIVWTLFFITFLQVGLCIYGTKLDKKFIKTTMSQIMPIHEQENPPISAKNQSPNSHIQSIQDFNGVIIQKDEIQQNLQLAKNIQNQRQPLNIETTLKIENRDSKQIESLGFDNQQLIYSQSSQIPESFKNTKNQPSQILQQGQSDQLQDLKQTQLQDKKLNQDSVQLNTLQQNQINQNKTTVSTFQDRSISHLVDKEIKINEHELKCIQKFLKLPQFLKFKVLHSYFNTIYTYEPDLSRPIRFNLIYLRIVHSLCLSTVFDQSYNINQQVIISIVSSIIIVVGVFFITTVHKIARVGQIISAFLMVCLLIFYYYVILAVISKEEPSFANSKYASFFLVLGIDIIFVQSILSVLKITILKNIQKHAIFYKLYNILGLNKLTASLTI